MSTPPPTSLVEPRGPGNNYMQCFSVLFPLRDCGSTIKLHKLVYLQPGPLHMKKLYFWKISAPVLTILLQITTIWSPKGKK